MRNYGQKKSVILNANLSFYIKNSCPNP